MSVALDHLLTIPCELVRRAYAEAPDEQGEQAATETVVASTCEVQQSGSREEQGGAVQITTYRVFLPADAPVRGWDALHRTDTDEVLELEGDAWLVRHPLSGAAHHVEAIAAAVD